MYNYNFIRLYIYMKIVQLLVHISDNLRSRLRIAAARKGVKMRSIIIAALEKYLDDLESDDFINS